LDDFHDVYSLSFCIARLSVSAQFAEAAQGSPAALHWLVASMLRRMSGRIKSLPSSQSRDDVRHRRLLGLIPVPFSSQKA
jgi:hypothetical protein